MAFTGANTFVLERLLINKISRANSVMGTICRTVVSYIKVHPRVQEGYICSARQNKENIAM